MKRHILLFECGHWTYESAPDTFIPDLTQPRVCSHFIAGQPSPHPDRYPRTSQGLPLVPVTHYLPDPRPCPYHDGSETCLACRDAGVTVRCRLNAAGQVEVYQNSGGSFTIPDSTWTTITWDGT